MNRQLLITLVHRHNKRRSKNRRACPSIRKNTVFPTAGEIDLEWKPHYFSDEKMYRAEDAGHKSREMGERSEPWSRRGNLLTRGKFDLIRPEPLALRSVVTHRKIAHHRTKLSSAGPCGFAHSLIWYQFRSTKTRQRDCLDDRIVNTNVISYRHFQQSAKAYSPTLTRFFSLVSVLITKSGKFAAFNELESRSVCFERFFLPLFSRRSRCRHTLVRAADFDFPVLLNCEIGIRGSWSEWSIKLSQEFWTGPNRDSVPSLQHDSLRDLLNMVEKLIMTL